MEHPRTGAEFDAVVSKAGPKTVVVDFTASWCPPCKGIAPVFEKLAKEFPHMVFCKVDVDENKETAEKFGIKAMPTFKFLKAGSEIDQLQGADPDKLRALIEKHQGDKAAAWGEGQALGGNTGASAGSSGPQTEKEKRLAALAARGL